MDSPNDNQSLVEVIVIALACMMLVQLTGELAKPYMPKNPRTVPCSVSIKDMARKLNVTLLSTCEVED